MPAVIYEKKGHIARLTLNRPEVHNAMDAEVIVRLAEAWQDFAADDSLWVAIITGAGDKAFCSGADLRKLIPLMVGSRQPEDEWDHRLLENRRLTNVALLRRFELYKPVIAAGFALGLGRAAFDRTLEFAKARTAFGQAIGSFQGIQWSLADMATRLEAARLLTYQAAWRADHGLPYITESSMAKLFASETATEIAKAAVLLHGSAGFMMEHDIQRFYRDCMVLEIGEGTSHIQRNTIARQLGL